MSKFLVSFLFGICFSLSLFSGELPNKTGNSISLKSSFGETQTTFLYTGKKSNIPDFSFITNSILLDYAIGTDLSLSVEFPYLMKYQMENRVHSGIGDALLSVDYFFTVNEKLPLLITLGTSLPIGKTAPLNDPIPLSTNELFVFTKLGVPFSVSEKLLGLVTVGYVFRQEPNNADIIALSAFKWKISQPIHLLTNFDFRSPIGAIHATPDNITGTANGVSFLNGSLGFDGLFFEDFIFTYLYTFSFVATNTAIFPNHTARLTFLFNN